MKRFVIAMLMLCLGAGCGAQNDKSGSTLRDFDYGYTAYAQLLDDYVIDNRVNYTELKVHRQTLDTLVDEIAVADLSKATTEQKLAFYINSYNILTLRSIVDAYPVESIKDIDGVWDGKKWQVAGAKRTLNQIEHKILRKEFEEPRIHLAIVCASIGCPPLKTEPYYPDSLDMQLASAAGYFATTPAYNRIDPETGSAELSSVFDWFGEDFIDKYYDETHFESLSKKENSVLNFLISQYPENERDALKSAEYNISYLEYDWSLNDTK